MLVDDRYVEFTGKLPTLFIVGAFIERPYRPDHCNFGMGLLYGIVNHLEAGNEYFRNHILVADSEIFQIEGFRMTGRGALGTPLGIYIAVSIFYQIKHILNISVHFFHRYAALLSACGQGIV